MVRNIVIAICLSAVAFFVFLGVTVDAETVRDRKFVDNQTSPNYNDGKYKGTLERYKAGGDRLTKPVTLNLSGWSEQDYICMQVSVGSSSYNWRKYGPGMGSNRKKINHIVMLTGMLGQDQEEQYHEWRELEPIL
ncbi:MAG TPA: hypothetical protein VK125_00895 [Bacillota bacterium]|nr:hypothetical protein [Bacillota bacterium]